MSVQRGRPLETTRNRDKDTTNLRILIVLVLALGAMGVGLYLFFVATAPPEVLVPVLVSFWVNIGFRSYILFLTAASEKQSTPAKS
jgi:hypothetical protein